jgi:hypothetical protein
MARAARVSAPGARRITIEGIMAVPDDYGRIRIVLADERPDGSPNRSKENYLRVTGGGAAATHRDTAAAVTAPAHRRAYWLGEAARLRGQWVTAEAVLRPFRNCGVGVAPGVALDLVALDAAAI